MLIRHGDRGPLSYVRNIASVDCSARHTNVLLNKYRTFLMNTTNAAPIGYLWNRSGPFHNFPLLSAFPKACLLGQLTYNGFAQMLQVGDLMKKVYAHALGLLTKPIPISRLPNATQPQPQNTNEEIIIYSTRYRRTFQSAMALLFAMIPTERWSSLIVRESQSLTFCFSDCSCPRADEIKDSLAKEFSQQFNHNPTVSAVVQWIGTNVMENPTPKMQPAEVKDAVLSLICHNAPLPCRRKGMDLLRYGTQNTNAPTTTKSTTESNDLINIDQDDGNGNGMGNIVGDNLSNRIIELEADTTESTADGCVEASHVEELLSYTQSQGDKEAQHRLTHQQGLLRAYGLLRNIVAHMLKIVSGDKTKFVLYSGHDRTLQYLMSALGLHTHNTNNDDEQFNESNPKLSFFIPYASRMAFEIYKSDTGNGDMAEHYFRVVNNGQDVTRKIDFCEGGRSLRIIKDSRGNRADLCPIENIIRFIHDDYFAIFNATNQKDACIVQKNSEF